MMSPVPSLEFVCLSICCNTDKYINKLVALSVKISSLNWIKYFTMIGLYLCMLLSCFSAQSVAASDAPMKQVFETQIFENDALDISLEEIQSYIESVHKVYSGSREDGIYKDMIERLVELSGLRSCDEDSFMKFYLLGSQPITVSLQRYIRNQRISMSKRRDEKLVSKFDEVVYDVDFDVRDLVDQIGRCFILPRGDDISGNCYKPDKFLTKSIYEFLADKSSKIADKQQID